MAYLVAHTAGAWDTAANWDTGINTPSVHAIASVVINSSGLATAVFTAPGLTDSCTGVCVMLGSIASGAGETLTVKLQEYDGVSAWVDKATQTFDIDDLKGTEIKQIRFASPYTFTTVTAGYYRYFFVMSSGSINMAADAGGSNPTYLGLYDLNNYPVTTDNALISSPTTSEMEMVISGTETVGNAQGASTSQSWRSWDFGCCVSSMGKLSWDTAASTKLENNGHFIVLADGIWEMDGATAGASNILELETECAAHGAFGITIGDMSQLSIAGIPKTSTDLWKANYVQGDGTTGTPLEVNAAVDWDVDDRIYISSTTAYNQFEVKYIKTKVSTTEFTLADSPGGAESGLSYSHTTDCFVVNCERNVQFTSKSGTYGYYFVNQNISTTNVPNIEWAIFEGADGTIATRRGIQIHDSYGTIIDFDYNVIWEPIGIYGLMSRTDRSVTTHTGIIQYKGNYAFPSATNKTWVDCFALRTDQMGFYNASGSNVTMTNCIASSCNYTNSTFYGGIYFNSTSACTVEGYESQASRVSGYVLSNVSATRFINCDTSYSDGKTQNIRLAPDTYNTITFSNSYFDSGATLVDAYTDLVPGSRIAFHKFNAINNKHFFYERQGIGQSTGATLDDTNVRTPDSLACRLAPEDSTDGLAYEFKTLARAGKAVYCIGFVQKNASMSGDDVEVELYLPGSSSPDDTYILPYDTDWNSFNVSANYTGSVDDYAVVRIIAKSTVAGAYAYIDDLYNGTDEINSLDAWYNGYPPDTVLEQVGDAAAVWAVTTASATTPGTFGEKEGNDLTTDDYLALR